MDAAERDDLVEQLALAFGGALDVTPADDQPPHIILPRLELPEPWAPSPTKALTIWANWPTDRPQFVIEEEVVGESGEPPRSNHSIYALGKSWRGFSFNFAWSSEDPVRVIQMWLTRFTAERS